VAVLSDSCMDLVGLGDWKDLDKHGSEERSELAELLSGGKLFEGSQPLSHCYAGYQFGAFSG